MLRVTLEQWRMLLAVVDHGGFNQASKVIHKSQSSIHHAVSKIEYGLGVNLFNVEGRKLVLTEQGETLYRRAQYLISEANKIEHVGKNLASGLESELRIAVDGVFPSENLYAVLEPIFKSHPEMRLELIETVLSGARELLEKGEVDIAIGGQPLKGGWNQPLMDVEFVAVAAPNHPLQKAGRKLTYEDLKTYRQIVVRDSARDVSTDSGWLEAEQRWTVSNLATSVKLIRDGHGFAWLPMTLIEHHLDNGSLKRLPMGDKSSRVANLQLSCIDWDALGPMTQKLAEMLLEICQESPDKRVA